MKQEYKELLLKDLTCRIPYGVIVNVSGISNVKLTSVSWYGEVGVDDGSTYLYPISEIKPYLFPLSSINEDQKEELLEITDAIKIDDIGLYYEEGDTLETYLSQMPYTFMCKVVTWCYKNHFDVNGLIPLDLAKNATGLNIY